MVFPKQTDVFEVDVELTAELTTFNPFDFFLEEHAFEFPFQYKEDERNDLKPFLETESFGHKFEQYLESIDLSKRETVYFLVDINKKLQSSIQYIIRMEPGVQTPEETLESGKGSCRDSAWLLTHLLRRLGLAARFSSGYLIQLKPDEKSLDGPSGAECDFTDLHAWCEVYLPGAGWIGLDPTSGLFAGGGTYSACMHPKAAERGPD